MPHGRLIKEERKEIRIGNFSLDGISHQTGDAAYTPATPHDLHHSRANNDSQNSHNTQHTRVKQNILSPARHVLEDTSHQIRPKIDAGDASLLIGSINKTRLAKGRPVFGLLFWQPKANKATTRVFAARARCFA
jgi:hypothetical protein